MGYCSGKNLGSCYAAIFSSIRCTNSVSGERSGFGGNKFPSRLCSSLTQCDVHTDHKMRLGWFVNWWVSLKHWAFNFFVVFVRVIWACSCVHLHSLAQFTEGSFKTELASMFSYQLQEYKRIQRRVFCCCAVGDAATPQANCYHCVWFRISQSVNDFRMVLSTTLC